MAKRMTDTAKYFPHDSNASAGDTLTMLQAEFKNDGYAFWFRLLERLAAADGHYLDMRNGSKWRTLAAKSYISMETADRIMELLIETEAIDVELWIEHKIIWCRNLLENLSDVYRNRRREMPQKPIVKDGIITCSYGVDTCSLHVVTDELHVNHMLKEIKQNKIKLKENSGSSSKEAPELEDCINYYSQNIGDTTVQTASYIEAAYFAYGGTWLLDAMKESIRQNKRSWAYVEGILRNWQQYGKDNPISRCTALKHK